MTDRDGKRRIVSDPEIRFGKPTVRGTRIAVEDILRMTSQGLSTADVLAQFPNLSKEDVLAAHEFAANHIRDAFSSHPEAAE